MVEIKKTLLRKDWRLTRVLRSFSRSRIVGALFGLFAHAGDSMVVIPSLLIWWIQHEVNDYQFFYPLWGSLFTASAATVVMKFAFRRRRPEGGISRFHRKADPFSFPSGHAVRCFNIATCVLLTYSPALGLLLWLWATAVSVGRIVQGIHYVYDVVAGAAMGITIACVFSLLANAGVFALF